jgi:ABC-type lipoprotein release transport system permease subunit
VIWESVWIGLTGLVAAAIVTAAPYYHLATKGLDVSKMLGGSGQAEISGVAFDPTIYVGIYPEKAVAIGVIVLLAVIAAGVYPAWKAGRVEPVDAIKLV